jgi:hypothetical protein
MSFIINPYRFATVAYDADYQAWLNRLTALGYTLPTAACSQILSDMIAGIKTDGNWTELDRFAFFAHNGDSDGATVDMINPSGHSQITKVNSPGWNAKQGFNGNGSSSYLNWNYALSTAAVKFTQNSASMGVWVHTGANSPSTYILGVRSATNTTFTGLADLLSPNVIATIFNNGSVNEVAFGTQTQFSSGSSYAATRASSTSVSTYRNGSLETNEASNNSSALSAGSPFILALNTIGTGAGFYVSSSIKISLAWAGSGSVDQSEMYTRLNTAMTAIALLP